MKTKTPLLILSLIFNLLLVLTACDDYNLPDIEACSYSKVSGKVYCGKYSMKLVKFIGELYEADMDKLHVAFIVPTDSWKLKLRPAILKMYRAEKDKKKKLFIEPKDKREIRKELSL